MSAPGLPQRTRFRAGVAALAAVALAIGAGVAIGKAADYTNLLHQLRGADAWWFLLCLVGEVVRYGGYLVAYRAVARVDGGPDLSFGTALRVVAAGFGVLVVATGVGALAVDYWALRRAGESRREALARVLALNTLEWGVLGAAAAAAAAVLLVGIGPDVAIAALLPWLVIVPACVVAAAWVSQPSRRERLTSLGGSRFRELFAAAIRGVVLVRALVARPGAGIGGTAAYWAGDLLCLWGGLKAFGVQIGLASLVLAYATGYLVAALPLPAGGAGGVDAAMTYALTLVGVPLAAALLGTFAYRLFNFWLPVVPALAILPTVRGLSDDLRRAETGFVH